MNLSPYAASPAVTQGREHCRRRPTANGASPLPPSSTPAPLTSAWPTSPLPTLDRPWVFPGSPPHYHPYDRPCVSPGPRPSYKPQPATAPYAPAPYQASPAVVPASDGQRRCFGEEQGSDGVEEEGRGRKRRKG
ncbi:hypothetical protein JMJ35_005916 [Cladonia borealis]|uniref:Uncharacterized protein n=1 Tax=Cladonia borealis TaxID=184061 RepID=A0AA39R103_9LECA|nr:hypothetical protein JMJ35_005916 [Cladonia borealis]